MGLFDFLRAKPAPAPPQAAPPQPAWQPAPSVTAAMRVGVLLLGRADAPEVHAVHGAIEAALARAFPTPALALAPFPEGALALVRVYWMTGPHGPYFHYLGWGLTEMGPKVSPKRDVSGFGIELSMKVRAFDDERGPLDLPAQNAPTWPAELLARLSRGILTSRRPYGHEHWIGAGQQGFGPENIRHLACAEDERIGAIDTPNGAFRFIQLYTIDDAELEACKAADRGHVASPVLAARRAADPDLVVARRR